jgi:hypothetical protein
MKKCSLLLPRGLRPMGIVFAGIGVILLIIRFYYGIKPELFNMKVFAIFSSYLEAKYFEVMKNQMIEEFGGILVLAGLFITAFTKEREEHEGLNTLRLRSLLITVYINTVFLILAIMFTFGFGFVYMMILNLILWLVLYIIIFRIQVFLNRDKEKETD